MTAKKAKKRESIMGVLRGLPELLENVYEVMRGLRDQVDGLRRVLASPSQIPEPVVTVLITGFHETKPMTFERVSAGQQVRLEKSGRADFEFDAFLPLVDVQIIILCDLERVTVSQMTCGQDILTPCITPSPVAYIKQWHMGQKLRIQCTRIP